MADNPGLAIVARASLCAARICSRPRDEWGFRRGLDMQFLNFSRRVECAICRSAFASVRAAGRAARRNDWNSVARPCAHDDGVVAAPGGCPNRFITGA